METKIRKYRKLTFNEVVKTVGMPIPLKFKSRPAVVIKDLGGSVRIRSCGFTFKVPRCRITAKNNLNYENSIQ